MTIMSLCLATPGGDSENEPEQLQTEGLEEERLGFFGLLYLLYRGSFKGAGCDTTTNFPVITTTTTIDFVNGTCNKTLGGLAYEAGQKITGLTPGVAYEVSMSCSNCCVEVTTMPKAVTHLTVAAVNTTAVHLSWLRQDDYKSGYSYQVTVLRGGEVDQGPHSTPTENFTVTSLTPGESYTLQVLTVVQGVNSAEETTTSYTMPKAVTNLTVAAVSTTAVHLSWLRQDDYKSGYSYQVTVLRGGKVDQGPHSTPTENFTVTSLTPGESYTLQVLTVVQGVNSAEETTTSYTMPKAVTNLTVAAVSTTAVHLSWLRQDDYKSGYSYQVTVLRGGKVDQGPHSTPTENFTVTSLTPGESYTLQVLTVVQGVNSAEETTTSYTMPKAVTNLTVAAVSTTAVHLSWLRQDDYKSGYSYQVTVLRGGEVDQGPHSTPTENFTVTSLTPGESYTLQVLTVVQGVNSAEETTTSYTMPKAVTNLTVAAVSTTAVHLSWLRQDDYKSGYSYQVTVLRGGKVDQGPHSTPTENFTVTSLTPGESYTLQVLTVVQGVNSAEETTTSYTMPKAVTNLTVAAVSTTAVHLSWLRQDDYKSGYSYQVTVLRGGKVDQGPHSTPTENFTVTSLTPGESYTLQVLTVVQGVNSAEETTTSYTMPKAVTNLTVAAVSTTAVHLSWLRQDDYKSGYSYQVTVLRGGKVDQGPHSTPTENFTVTSLTPGESYTLQVLTVVQGVNSAEETTTSYTMPKAVTNLTVAAVSTTAVHLSWLRQDDYKSGYSYQVTVLRGGKVDQGPHSTPTENFTVTSLTPGESYTLQVLTVVQGVNSAEETTTSYTMPKAVTNLTVAAVSTTAVHLSWLRQDDYKSGYSYQVTVLRGGKVDQGPHSTPTENFTVTSLTPGESYTLQVLTVVQGVNSAEETTTSYTMPKAVTNLTVAAVSTTAVHLSWLRQDDYKSGYSYQVTVLRGGKVDQGPHSTPTENFTVTSLTPGESYTLQVLTVVQGVNSAEETTTSYTMPKAVTNLTVAAVSTTAVHLSWLRQDDYKSGYSYQVTVLRGGKVDQGPHSTPTENFTVTSLTPGESYTLQVLTVVQGVNSAEETTTSYTMPKAVTNLTVAAVSTTAVHLSWLRQDDYKSGYSYQVTVLRGGKVDQGPHSTPTENFTVTSLTPGESYTLQVLTVVQGVNSAEETTTSYTMPKAVTNLTVAAVSTTAVHLSWLRQDDYKSGYSYQVTVLRGGKVDQGPHSTPTENFTVTSLTPGESYTLQVLTVVQGVNSAEETTTSYTMPKAVTNLTVAAVSTTAVHLSWLRQDDYKSGYSYQVTVLRGGEVDQHSTPTENFTVTSLTPGENYTFEVLTVVQSVQSTVMTTTSCTMPKAVTHLTVAAVNTTAVHLSWFRQDDFKSGYSYQVTVLKGGEVDQGPQSTPTENFTVTSLTPGESYTLQVLTVVQGVNSTEETTTSYTMPKAVTDLSVAAVNTTAVHLSWLRQDDYKSGYSYQVTVLRGGEVDQHSTPTENFTVTSLTPGENYTFEVLTVVQSVQSTVMTTTSCTKPNPVINLQAHPNSTTSVKVEWSVPDGAKPYYKYRVQPADMSGTTTVQPTQSNSTVVTDLQPGTGYDFNVTVVASGCESAVEQAFSYTMPKAVTHLTVAAVNTTAVHLSWLRQDDFKSGYSYQVTVLKGGEVDQGPQSTPTENFTVTSLTPGESYTLQVLTVVQGVNSTEETTTSYTMPKAVTDLSVAAVNTTAVHLSWLRQDDYKSGYSYQVTVLRGGEVDQHSTPTENFTVTSLTPGENYTFEVLTVVQSVQSTVMTTTSCTMPKAVTHLTVAAVSTTAVHLSWLRQDDFKSGYSYQVTVLKGGEVDQGPQSTPTENFTVTSLTPGESYTLQVLTVVQGVNSTEETTTSYTMPKAVTDLSVAAVNTTAVHLSWLRQDDYKSGYSYQVTVLRGGEVDQHSTPTENFTVTSLTPGENYTFEVLTVVQSVQSTVMTTFSCTMPKAVTHLTVAAVNTTAVHLSWLRQDDYKSGYSYQVTVLRGGVVDQGPQSTPTENFTVTSLTPGENYTFEVLTVVQSVQSTVMTTTSCTKPNPVINLQAHPNSTTSVKVEWSVPDGAKPYYKYRVQPADMSGTTTVQPTQSNSTVVTDLQPGTGYDFNVTVVASGCESAVEQAFSYTMPKAVTHLTVAAVNTTAVHLSWFRQDDFKSGYSYQVTVLKGGEVDQGPQSTPTENFTVTSLTPGESYTLQVLTVVQGVNSTEETTTSYTMPKAVTDLSVAAVNTTAVHLSWLRQDDYKSGYSYQVTVLRGGEVDQHSTPTENFTVTSLTPGENYTFEVLTVVQSVQSTVMTTTSCTMPKAVTHLTVAAVSTTAVHLSWLRQDDFKSGYSYQVTVLKGGEVDQGPQSTPTENFTVTSLTPGENYTFEVLTVVQSVQSTVMTTTSCTMPKAVTHLTVAAVSTTAVHLSWLRQDDFKSGYSYQVTVLKGGEVDQGPQSTPTENFTVTSLTPGESYTLQVLTVVQGVNSTEETTTSYTMPKAVTHLTVAAVNTTAVHLSWLRQDDYKSGYSYQVTVLRGGVVDQGPQSTPTENFTVTSLTPGENYTFEVLTVVQSVQSTVMTTTSCTRASPVPKLGCYSPDRTDAKIILSWGRPKGRNSGFILDHQPYQHGDGRINETYLPGPDTCNPNCTHTVLGLQYYKTYQVTMRTQGCGRPSTPLALFCTTGITDPVIPTDYNSFVTVTQEKHNMFTIEIEPSLLDSTNGPISHLGVLVTDSIDGVDSSNLKQYLDKTYQHWSAGTTTTYLATVKGNLSTVGSGVRSRSVRDAGPLAVAVGDGGSWEAYTNGALKANRQYRYAIILFTQLKVLPGGIVDSKLSLATPTAFYTVVHLPQNPAVINMAVGASLGIFCVLFIITIGFIIYWKKMSKKERSDIQIHSVRNMSVHMEDYEAYFKKQKVDSNCGFAEEFEDLKPVGTAQPRTSGEALENKPKNRYNNVLPYDSSRVKLSIHGSQFDDYINANYMPGFNSKKEFIAAQGPLPGTVNEFWRMVWEKNIQTLVMLTGCIEQGRVKCEKYWPNESKHFGNITVTMTSEIALEDWTLRDFDMKNVKTAETRSVRHFHFTAWPDHGVPESTELLINFRHLVREHMDQFSSNSPSVVHCSAGVGRTGTFIAIDRLIFQIERESLVDVYGVIHDLRMHRTLMVQTEDQYVFLNQCALDIIRSRTGTNVDLIYQNADALCIYENIEPKKERKHDHNP
ncbi:hypothetical protein NHX12_002999 [Muraenolepis orangiensis]|uniref:protein-tyrosine-phosphatase n=1 Tax=Muraenolepis orangiensis TaxID=630683 RepID=A0A9Q0DY50_9TELE|nr:hypothetical protein NHX12_002999 [Muraenolepis orangiensis]